MRSIDLYTAIRAVDDDILERSETASCERKKKSGWLKWGAVAACFGLILTVAIITLPSVLKEPSSVMPPSNPNLQVEYATMSLDWPVYESADELIEACDVVAVGTVTNISFQVLDTRTGKIPEADTEDLYCSLYTIYDIDITKTYKGNSKDAEQIRVIGGFKGAYEAEQLAALGQEQATIFVLDGLIEISEGETYLFMLHQYEDTLPTIINVEQSIYSISDAFSDGSKQDGKITVQEIISSFGPNEWVKFESIAKESFIADHSQELPDKSSAPAEYPDTTIVPGFDLDEPGEPVAP